MKTSIAIALCAVLGLGGLASAASVGPFSANIALTDTDYTDTFSIPTFNSSLGTLTSILFELEGELLGSIGYENNSGNTTIPAEAFELTLLANLTIDVPGGGGLEVLVTPSSSVENAALVPVFDGTLDFGGTSGQTFNELGDTDTDSLNTSNASVLAIFNGDGVSTVNVPAAAQGGFSGLGQTGNLDTSFQTQAGGTLSVTYFYSTDDEEIIPEPMTLGSVGLAVAAGFGAMRRRLRG